MDLSRSQRRGSRRNGSRRRPSQSPTHSPECPQPPHPYGPSETPHPQQHCPRQPEDRAPPSRGAEYRCLNESGCGYPECRENYGCHSRDKTAPYPGEHDQGTPSHKRPGRHLPTPSQDRSQHLPHKKKRDARDSQPDQPVPTPDDWLRDFSENSRQLSEECGPLLQRAQIFRRAMAEQTALLRQEQKNLVQALRDFHHLSHSSWHLPTRPPARAVSPSPRAAGVPPPPRSQQPLPSATNGEPTLSSAPSNLRTATFTFQHVPHFSGQAPTAQINPDGALCPACHLSHADQTEMSKKIEHVRKCVRFHLRPGVSSAGAKSSGRCPQPPPQDTPGHRPYQGPDQRYLSPMQNPPPRQPQYDHVAQTCGSLSE